MLHAQAHQSSTGTETINLPLPVYCPAHRSSLDKRDDQLVMEEMLLWFKERLPCVAGRREFNKHRYMIEIASGETVSEIFQAFVSAVRSHTNTACLFVFNEPKFYAGRGNAASAFQFLAEQMSCLSTVPAEALAGGAALSQTIRLQCPVTGTETDFDDFECIAFCPQSSSIDDLLYDPLMCAPYACVNMSSDVFAFSYFVMESCMTKYGKAPHQIRDLSILVPLFTTCIERWNKIASVTIGNFAAITDTSRCPVHLTDDGSHWIAAHRDPAFAEFEKVPHRHELPIVYASRICDAWIEHFSDGCFYSARGLAREGMLQ